MQHGIAGMIDQLISLKGSFSVRATSQKQVLLKQLSGTAITDVNLLKNYHDCLLFILAYPGNKENYGLALQQLQNIQEVTEKIFNSHLPKKQHALNGSGICSSELVCAFSYDISLWLYNTFGNSISLHSSEADAEQVSKILESLLPGMEYQEITQSNYRLPQRIQKLTGQKNSTVSLNWLLNILHNNTTSPQIRNILFEQLQVFVQWKLNHPFFNRTFLRSLPPQKMYYHKPTAAITDYEHYIRKKIKPARGLSAEEKIQLLNTARTALALHNRETDPVTFGDNSTVKYFDMGNGISIALYSMLPQNRFSIESYIGYMAFVNSVPAAYGGGWLLGHRCKIGISIFPALRGGNSTLLFAAILRLYHRYYNASRFVVKPYQFGKNNRDGLRSGAFWFYYKLGFRPADPLLQQLAEEESGKKGSVKNYKVPLTTLKKFTVSNLELLLDRRSFPHYDAGLISKAVTKNIILNFTADRRQAVQSGIQQLKKMAGTSGQKLTAGQFKILTKQAIWMSLLFWDNKKMKGWTKPDRQQFIRLLLSKYAADERDYIICLQQHKKMWDTLNGIIQTGKQ